MTASGAVTITAAGPQLAASRSLRPGRRQRP